MLVLSRDVGESITVTSGDEGCVITVLKIFSDEHKASILTCRAWAGSPGEIGIRTADVGLDDGIKIGAAVEIRLIDVRGEKVRLGIIAPRESSVHRLEVYEAIQNENRGNDVESDEGGAGSRVPRLPSPKPPSLDVRLDKPRSETDDGA